MPTLPGWVHKEKPKSGRTGGDNYTQEEMDDLYNEYKELGKPPGKGSKSNRGGQFRKPRGRGLKCVWWLSLIGWGVDIYEAWEEYQKCQQDPCICDPNCI